MFFCWKGWCHAHEQWQSWNPSIFLSKVLGSMLELVGVQKAPYTSQMVRWRQSWGWMLHLKENGGILLKGPMWRNILHHSAERNILYFRHGPDEFSGYFFECTVVNHLCVFLCLPLGWLWWVLTNWISFLITFGCKKLLYFILYPLIVFHGDHIGVFAILAQRFLYLSSFLLEESCWRFHLVQIEMCTPPIVLQV